VYAALHASPARAFSDLGRDHVVIVDLEPAPVSSESWRERARDSLRRRRGTSALPDLLGAHLGYFAYEAGAWMERMPPAAVVAPMPLAWLGVARRAFLFHRPTRTWSTTGPRCGEILSDASAAATPSPGPARGVVTAAGQADRYRRGVERILGHLRAGDCYQVNLARRFDIAEAGDAFGAWLRLRARNPARRGMLLEFPGGAVVCNSPELLLEVRGGRVLSVPIKGTAPTHADPGRLLRSTKERAELTMIVDLVRSDLARVAAPGSIGCGPRRVGRVGHVWHAMRRVHAVLDVGRDAADAFAAVFPAGSVTGAPKVRAMEVIGALEDGARGVYCGSIGWFAPGGWARWNVAIRTITFRGGAASLHVGAGIVLGSDPGRELRETELKAQAMLAAIAAPGMADRA
jgi:anthranilate/para-aminobenzoate synthase component I